MEGKEEWKVIEEFPKYQISNYGHVKSMSSWSNGKILRPQKAGAGYAKVILCNKGSQRPFYVHRLVGKYFLEKKDEHTEINHRNGIKFDNRSCNLYWCTHSHNLEHAYRTGLKIHWKLL